MARCFPDGNRVTWPAPGSTLAAVRPGPAPAGPPADGALACRGPKRPEFGASLSELKPDLALSPKLLIPCAWTELTASEQAEGKLSRCEMPRVGDCHKPQAELCRACSLRSPSPEGSAPVLPQRKPGAKQPPTQGLLLAGAWVGVPKRWDPQGTPSP